MNLIKNIPKLSAVRKVLETLLFLALGSFETSGSKLSHGTSSKFADVRTHQGKFLAYFYYSSEENPTPFSFTNLSLRMVSGSPLEQLFRL